MRVALWVQNSLKASAGFAARRLRSSASSRERGFGSLKYERLFLEEIPDAIDLAAHVEHYRIEYNTVRPHENLSWNRPIEVHLGYADPKIPNFPEPQNLPSA